MSKKKPVKYKSRKAEMYRSPTCLNCRASLRLTDKYCPQCSQLNSTKQLSLKDFFNEFFSSIVVYDSRLRYTLKDLLFKPGTITRNYVQGQRLKYANPFRFYLSISIIYFLAQSVVQGISIKFKEPSVSTNNSNEHIVLNINKKKNVDTTFYQKESTKDVKKDTTFKYISQAELDTVTGVSYYIEQLKTYREFYRKTRIKDPAQGIDSLKLKYSKTSEWLYNRGKVIVGISENPYSFVYFLFNKTPFFLFFFAPIFALFFWLFYVFKKKTYMEHLVFVFHVFSFMFLALFISLLIELIINNNILSILTLSVIGPFYFYKALRNFYQEKRWITFFKFIFLSIIFLLGISFAGTFFIIFSAAIY